VGQIFRPALNAMTRRDILFSSELRMTQKHFRLGKAVSVFLGVAFVATVLPLALSAPFFQHDATLMSKARAEHLEEDGKLMRACTSLLYTMSPAQIDAFQETDKYRDCLLNTAPQIQTDLGAIGFGYQLVYRLARHPEDAAVKAAAESLVERGLQWRSTHFSAIAARMEREVAFARLSLPVRYYVPADSMSEFDEAFTVELVKLKGALDDPTGFEKAQRMKMDAALAKAPASSASVLPSSAAASAAVAASSSQ